MSKVLDSIDMYLLGDVFSSKARTEVLRGLCVSTKPVGLRKLARITGLRPRSVELALNGLQQQGLVERVSCSEHSDGYCIQNGHQMTDRLRAVFLADLKEELHERSALLAERGLGLCDFMDEGLALVMRGRRSLHDVDGMS